MLENSEFQYVVATTMVGAVLAVLATFLCKLRLKQKKVVDDDSDSEQSTIEATSHDEKKTLPELVATYEADVVKHANGLRTMTMNIGENSFPVLIGHNSLSEMVAAIKRVGEFDAIYLGYDTNTDIYCAPQLEAELKAQGVKFFRHVMDVTETAKQINTLDEILNVFFKNGGTRKTIVMPVGGGIVGNTFGLSASLLFRGIRLVQMPTTLLSAHDAAASSMKQAINHAGYKNVVGSFYPPVMALVDTSFFKTLGTTEIKAGLGELTKNAALFGQEHYELIKNTTMRKGANLTEQDLADSVFSGLGAKDMLLKHDPKEKTLAIIFEYGHTVGHALELCKGLETSHGEGVTVGMLAASYISNRMGLMTDTERKKHDDMVFALNPKVILPDHDILDECFDKVKHDNKRGYLPEREGFCPFILLKKVGEVHSPNPWCLEYVAEDLVQDSIRYVVDMLRAKKKLNY